MINQQIKLVGSITANIVQISPWTSLLATTVNLTSVFVCFNSTVSVDFFLFCLVEDGLQCPVPQGGLRWAHPRQRLLLLPTGKITLWDARGLLQGWRRRPSLAWQQLEVTRPITSLCWVKAPCSLASTMGKTFKWLLSNDIGYLAMVLAVHQREREGGDTTQSAVCCLRWCLCLVRHGCCQFMPTMYWHGFRNKRPGWPLSMEPSWRWIPQKR